MKKWLMIILPLAILGSLIGWRLQQKQAATSGQATMQSARKNAPASVELANAEIRDIVSTFEATGAVESVQNVKISPKLAGRVEFIQVREGDRVRAGQVLVKIDQSSSLADVRQQRAAVAEAKYRLAQAQLTQGATDSSVTTQVRQQEAGLGSAKADLHQAEKTRLAQYESVKASLADSDSRIEAAQAGVANANAGIRSAQANLDNATAKYNRVSGLFKLGYVPAQAVDDAKTTVSVQQAAVESAKGLLQSATAGLNSAKQQKLSAEQQADITRAKADADLESAKARLIQSKASVDYAQANTKQSPAYRQSIEALRAGVAAAQASLDSSVAKLADTVLRSPMDGVITERDMDQGSMANAGQAILAVQAMKKVWVTVAVPEDVCAKLHINDPGSVRFDALGGEVRAARIAQINPAADPQSRQYTVRVILDNADGILKAGMFAHVSFTTGKAVHVVAVPHEAIEQDKNGGNYVVVAGKDFTAQFCPVTTGPSDAKWIAVTSGLEAKQKVVTMSASPVKDGQKLSTGKGRKGKRGRMKGKQ